MNQNRKEELLTRWMDDALSAEERREFEPVLAEHPEWKDERGEYAKMREDLRAAMPSEVEPPYPDFFNAHLKRLVEESAHTPDREEKSRKGLSRLWSWWMAPAATAALVAAFVAGMQLKPSNVPAPLTTASATALYSPMANVHVESMVDADLDATVIVLTGLDDIADQDLLGWSGSYGKDNRFLAAAHNSRPDLP